MIAIELAMLSGPLRLKLLRQNSILFARVYDTFKSFALKNDSNIAECEIPISEDHDE